MITVYYHPIMTSRIYDKSAYIHPLFADGVYIEPKKLIDEDTTHAKLEYYHCPAWRHTASNTFVFYNQLDLDFKYDLDTKKLDASKVREDHWQELVGIDPNFLPNTGVLIAQISTGAVFWSEDRKDLWINQQPFWNLSKQSNLELIGASMPIGVWSRPVNIAVKALDNHINLKRGQPIFTVNFSDFKENIKLVRKEPSPTFMDKLRQYIDVKNYLPKASWNIIKRKSK